MTCSNLKPIDVVQGDRGEASSVPVVKLTLAAAYRCMCMEIIICIENAQCRANAWVT